MQALFWQEKETEEDTDRAAVGARIVADALGSMVGLMRSSGGSNG